MPAAAAFLEGGAAFGPFAGAARFFGSASTFGFGLARVLALGAGGDAGAFGLAGGEDLGLATAEGEALGLAAAFGFGAEGLVFLEREGSSTASKNS